MSDIVRSCSSSAVQILLGMEPTRLENKILCLLPSAIVQSNKTGRFRLIGGGNVRGRTILAANSSKEGGVQSLDNLPMSIVPESILSETQFDRIVGEAQQRQEPVVITWMAGWCRKCIYLKPKLEKLAAEYFPRIRFFDIDVNNVSHKLVVRAGVTGAVYGHISVLIQINQGAYRSKMPTIQLWKDGEKQEEVIGGHKAHLVVNEIREMIENAYAL